MKQKFILPLSSTFTIILLFCFSLRQIECGKVPIQAHSFNDLDYISNLLNRGIDVYKIDMSMANKKSCEQYSTWKHTNNCYKSNQFIQQICCLAIRGDTSSMLSFSYPFNTSQEFVSFLDKQLTNIIVNQPQRRVMFAIDFQYRFSFNDFITEGFLVALANVLSKFPKNLLLGSGDDDFVLQYDRICFGKGAPQCTDSMRKISKSNIFLQTSAMNPFDSRDYYKRFRNFNAFFEGVSHYCKNGFPDWIHNYPQFPLIFWEPSSQPQIQFVLNQFLKPQCIKKHGRNISGLAIASNLDPEMLDLYSRKLVQLTTFSNINNQQNALNKSFNPKTQKVFVNEQINLRLTKIKVKNSQIFCTASQSSITNKLLLQKWEFDAKSQQFKLTQSRQLGALFSQTQTIVDLLQDGSGYLILVTFNNKNIQKPNKIYYFQTETLGLLNFADWVKVQTVCMKEKELVYVNCDKQYNICTIKGAIQLKQTPTNISFSVRMFLSKITSMQVIENGFLIIGNSIQNKYLSGAILIRNGQLIPPLLPLSLGQNPKIIKKQTGKQFAVLLQNAMCHCATLINNNGMNKCTAYKQPQLQSLRNIKGIINLMQFNLQDLLKNQQIVSPCHPKISLTKVMNGLNIDLIELVSLDSYMIASEYLRIQDQDVMSSLFCGPSNFDKAFHFKVKSSIISTFYLTNQTKYYQNQISIK